MELPIYLPLTNSLTGLLTNISNSSDTNLLIAVPLTTVPLYIIQPKPSEISIGEHKVQSQVLKTKVNVDHVGHFLLLVLLKEPTCLTAIPIKALNYSQSNNLLTAQTKTKVVKVAPWTLLSSMLKNMLLRLKVNIHTLLKTVHAKMMVKVLSRQLVTLMSVPADPKTS
jgi:hypothetical protein